MGARIEYYCDVCGNHAVYHIRGMTGRVILDGRDMGQDVDLCEEHRPDEAYHWQPRNTDRMIFHWAGPRGENMYPPIIGVVPR